MTIDPQDKTVGDQHENPLAGFREGQNNAPCFWFALEEYKTTKGVDDDMPTVIVQIDHLVTWPDIVKFRRQGIARLVFALPEFVVFLLLIVPVPPPVLFSAFEDLCADVGDAFGRQHFVMVGDMPPLDDDEPPPPNRSSEVLH